MKIAYFDCFSGASGDMILGAMLDAGLSLSYLREQLARLNLSHYEVGVEKVVKRGIGGSQALVRIQEDHHHHHHRHLSDIREIIEASSLDAEIKQKSQKIFMRLAEAEAKVHRVSPEAIHFHEVGAMDAIIDVVGGVIGLTALGIDKVYCSPLHVGTGTVECAHGILPVPAPATAELIKGKPVYATGVQGELLTPTGAAILTTLAEAFGPMPAMTLEAIGYGAGTAERSLANMLRIVIGTIPQVGEGYEVDQTAVIETTIDDMNPQIYDFLIDEVFRQGALDIFFAPVQMKKNRYGTLLTVLCDPVKIPQLADVLFRQTTTIGLRWRIENRIKTARTIITVETPYGRVSCKAAVYGEEVINWTPEYDECKRIAEEKRIPIKRVMEAARAAAVKLDEARN
jgi:pyridinium-3,5-bisthiocarboxylic acid mononucleotide nickel chelatase